MYFLIYEDSKEHKVENIVAQRLFLRGHSQVLNPLDI